MLTVVSIGVIAFGLILVVVQLIRGDHGLGWLKGESRETRRAVRRAIRDGGTDDPGIDRLARRVIRSAPRVGWAKYFFGVMLVMSVYLLVRRSDETLEVVQRVLQSALWTGLIVLIVVNERRLNAYRGLAGDS